MASSDGVFVRLACTRCGRSDLFLKCDRCGRQALFTLGDAGVTCGCGATYGHGVCACGAEVPPAQLTAVPFEAGPMVWSELEIDPIRAGVLAVAVVSVVGALGWWWIS